jgi:hypothetical protein
MLGTFFGKKIKAHRAAWLLYYGEWPNDAIDHINGNPGDNRIANLRVVDQLTNQKNAKRPKNNTSGAVGLIILKGSGRWRAAIKVNYQEIHLGVFDRFEDAFRARKAAERKYGFHPNHGRAMP